MDAFSECRFIKCGWRFTAQKPEKPSSKSPRITFSDNVQALDQRHDLFFDNSQPQTEKPAPGCNMTELIVMFSLHKHVSQIPPGILNKRPQASHRSSPVMSVITHVLEAVSVQHKHCCSTSAPLDFCTEPLNTVEQMTFILFQVLFSGWFWVFLLSQEDFFGWMSTFALNCDWTHLTRGSCEAISRKWLRRIYKSWRFYVRISNQLWYINNNDKRKDKRCLSV